MTDPFDTLREALTRFNRLSATPESSTTTNNAYAALGEIKERLEALRLAVARQLTPLDVAATHIDILRRKSEDYTPQERDNVALIVEQHVNEARKALFDELKAASGKDKP